MSKARQQTTGQPDDLAESPDDLGSRLDFYLSRESDGAGYVWFQEAEDYEGMFSSPQTDLEYFDSVSSDNVLLSKGESAKLLEHYFGQLSREDELDDFLEYIDTAVLEPGEVEEMDGALVLELDLVEYDGSQHIHRYEGEVSREVVEYLDEESCWSRHTHFMEEEDRLFIRSNP